MIDEINFIYLERSQVITIFANPTISRDVITIYINNVISAICPEWHQRLFYVPT